MPCSASELAKIIVGSTDVPAADGARGSALYTALAPSVRALAIRFFRPLSPRHLRETSLLHLARVLRRGSSVAAATESPGCVKGIGFRFCFGARGSSIAAAAAAPCRVEGIGVGARDLDAGAATESAGIDFEAKGCGVSNAAESAKSAESAEFGAEEGRHG